MLIVLFHAPLWVYRVPNDSNIITMFLKVKSHTSCSSLMECSSFMAGLVGGVDEMRSDIRGFRNGSNTRQILRYYPSKHKNTDIVKEPSDLK